MKLSNTEQLLNLDALYGYCHKTQQYEICNEVTGVVSLKGRKGIKGIDPEDNKLYTQISNSLYEQLVEKFEILKDK
jgi:hypothetical protein